MSLFSRDPKIDGLSAIEWYNKGFSLDNLGRYNDAIRAYDRAIELDPKDAQAWYNKGISLDVISRHEEAVRAYDRAIELDPRYNYIWNEIGISLDELGRHEEAVRAYDRAIELDPEDGVAWNARGSSLAKLGRYKEAVRAFDRAIELDPSLKDAVEKKSEVMKKLEAKTAAVIQPPTPVRSQQHKEPCILRESEFYGGAIRVKISVRNEYPSAILDVTLDPEIDEGILYFDRYEPTTYQTKMGKILLGNIHPGSDRTISLYLEPLICAKEGTDVNCLIRYKDASGAPKVIQMEPLKIRVICPIFKTEKPVNIGQMKELVSSLRTKDYRVYTLPARVNEAEVLDACKHTALLHDIWHISTLRKEAMIESWYYGKTKVSKKDLIIMTFIDKSANHLEVMVIGDDPKDITGLLAEVHRNLTDEFSRIGRLQNIYNISIKDSVVQRTNLLSYCQADGTCQANIAIQDSVVQRSNIMSSGPDRSDEI